MAARTLRNRNIQIDASPPTVLAADVQPDCSQ